MHTSTIAFDNLLRKYNNGGPLGAGMDTGMGSGNPAQTLHDPSVESVGGISVGVEEPSVASLRVGLTGGHQPLAPPSASPRSPSEAQLDERLLLRAASPEAHQGGGMLSFGGEDMGDNGEDFVSDALGAGSRGLRVMTDARAAGIVRGRCEGEGCLAPPATHRQARSGAVSQRLW